MSKPFSKSCENNKQPILEVLQTVFADRQRVLEVGSGTGQHAVFFGQHLPHLTWCTGDLPNNHAGINAWLAEAALENVEPPLILDVDADQWPPLEVDAVYSANTLHIISWPQVERFFNHVGSLLSPGGKALVYGPFNYQGRYTSDSNARFDVWLAEQNPLSAIRDFEAVNALAQGVGLQLQQDYSMPANNRILLWRKD